MIKVLILGCGSTAGLGVVRSLSMAKPRYEVVGCDHAEDAAGFAYCDEFLTLVRIEAARSAERLIELIRRLEISYIIPCDNYSVQYTSTFREEIESQSSSTLLCSARETLDLTEDKWECYRHLLTCGLPQPHTIHCSDFDELQAFTNDHGFPVVAKLRRGSGSKELTILRKTDDIDRLKERLCDGSFILQEHIGETKAEYSVGLTVIDSGQILSEIVLRRYLKGGMTYGAHVEINKGVAEMAKRVASCFLVRGYLNVQLRISRGVPIAFDINSRPSTSNFMRTLAGVNEAAVLLRHFSSGVIEPPPVASNKYFIRHLGEKVVRRSRWQQMFDGR